MTFNQQLFTIAVVVAGTMLTRFLPFLVFGSEKPTPEYIRSLGRILPSATLGMLVVYCFKDVSFTGASHGLPEILSLLFIIVLHYWKKNMFLSIVGGIACYMLILHIF